VFAYNYSINIFHDTTTPSINSRNIFYKNLIAIHSQCKYCFLKNLKNYKMTFNI